MSLRNSHIRKRTLVTDRTGFVGAHVCRRLLSEGHDVVCEDNFVYLQRRVARVAIVSMVFELAMHCLSVVHCHTFTLDKASGFHR